MSRSGIVKSTGLLGILFLSGAILTLPARAQSCGNSPSYYVASMNMSIDPGAQDFMTSSIDDARASCANRFVLVLDTFGGDGGNMDNIVKAISGFQASGGTVVALIGPSGSHAFSAGAYIAEASDKVYMTPGTAIGSATPIVYNIPTGEENTTLAKDISGFKSYMQALTSHFGRNASATGLMVTVGRSYTAEEAARFRVIDGEVNATSLEAALGAIGVPASAAIHTPSIRSQAISVLSDPNLSGILFLLGVFAILTDFYHPTVFLSIAGVVAIGLALFGLGVFGAPAISVALMVIGTAFIFLEVKTHHGVSALAGVLIFAIGFLLIFRTPPPPVQPVPNQPPAANFSPIGTLTYLFLGLLGGAVVVGSVYLYKLREGVMKRPLGIDPKSIVGKEGRLITDLRAGGTATANVGSEEWTVTASQDIPGGSAIKVKEVLGLKLTVERKED